MVWKKRIFTVLLCCLMLLTIGACGKANAPEEDSKNMTKDDVEQLEDAEQSKEKAHVILLAGQSNASGISETESLKMKVSAEKFSQYRSGYENIQIYYYVDRQNKSWEFVPVALGQGSTETHFGPEVGIAAYLSENFPKEKFYIIKASMSGSNIMNWQDSSDIYQDMITAIENGFSELTANNLEPEWFATCWMQGESDSLDAASAKQYYWGETDLMKRLQQQFKQYASPNGVSLIDAGISDFTGWPFHEEINEAKKRYASENPMNFYLDTSALTYDQDNDDYAHYDAVPMLELGRMFGEKIEEAAVKQGYIKGGTAGRKLVALTFDDGPNEYFPEYLSLFEEYNWRCTFFVLGGYVSGNSEMVADCLEAGMEFANHSYSHRNFTDLTDEEIREELQTTENLIELATNRKASVKCARLPTMMGNERIYNVAKKFGYVWVGSVRYDIGDGGGFENKTPASEISRKILESLYDGAIYCLHAAPNTLEALKQDVLPALEEQGYACVTVSEILEAKGATDLPYDYSIRDAYLANTDEEVAENMKKYQ